MHVGKRSYPPPLPHWWLSRVQRNCWLISTSSIHYFTLLYSLGLSELTFSSPSQQQARDFFTPIRDFTPDAQTPKDEGRKTATTVFTPFIDTVQSKQPATDELMLFTPHNTLSDVKVDNVNVHKRPIVGNIEAGVISPLTVSPDVEGMYSRKV